LRKGRRSENVGMSNEKQGKETVWPKTKGLGGEKRFGKSKPNQKLKGERRWQ